MSEEKRGAEDYQVFDFGRALELLNAGERLMRLGWNGKNMWIVLVSNGQYEVAGTDGLSLLPWIGMKTATGGFVPWLASQTDILAVDWQVVPYGRP